MFVHVKYQGLPSAECRVPSIPPRYSSLLSPSQGLCIVVLYYAQRAGRQRKGVGSPEGNASHGREAVVSAIGSAGETVAPARGGDVARGTGTRWGPLC